MKLRNQIYRLNDSLQYVRVRWPQRILIFLSICLIASMIVSFSITLDKKIIEKQVILIMEKQNQFDEQKLVTEIKKMNFSFPYIVYGQALLETDHFKSRIFMENKNLFGMKLSTKRVTLSNGSQSDYAYYSTWTNSLYDYGLYCATYLSKLNTEEDYFNFLSQFYAEDSMYCA